MENHPVAEKLNRLPQTPMWQQYIPIKQQALDALLFYRMGDFYELFLDDAEIAASILGITLTARHKDAEFPVPMCGVPFHSATTYINKLLANGKRVAICEQTSDPQQGKIVQREIVKIVSPGMAYDNDSLEANENNFFFTIWLNLNESKVDNNQEILSIYYSALDISTGECFFGNCKTKENLLLEIYFLQPKEFFISEEQRELISWIPAACITPIPNYYLDEKMAFENLCHHFQVKNLEAFGLHADTNFLKVVGAAFRKIKENQKLASLQHLRPPLFRDNSDSLQLDESTIDHLDIFPKPGRNEKESVYGQIDRTSTAMGARFLKNILKFPLRTKSKILERQEAITALLSNFSILHSIRESLKGMRDLERLMAKLGLESATPRDLLALCDTLIRFPHIRSYLEQVKHSSLLNDLSEKIQSFPIITQSINTKIREDSPSHIREGNIFKSGWHSELDEYLALASDGTKFINDLESKEKQTTGITSLKIKYNRVFGYYIEVTKSYLHLVPPHYVRKQTTANAERYITEELKIYEDKILHSEERRVRLEQKLFAGLLNEILEYSNSILETAQSIAYLDAIVSLSQIALEENYVRPEITDGLDLEIIEGRHPVVENLLGKALYIPNDIYFSLSARLFLITGPNMAGKSTYMRQIAILTLLAQTGAFIPATSATIGLVDRIASRVGASDRISQGQSTFMVEMNEIARILRQSTEKSLLIIDEIGRGTSTFDGLAIAWSIVEDIHNRIQARTLFATHYHELTALEENLNSLRNLHVRVGEENGNIVFLHKVGFGSASGSYGIEVAKLAGVPQNILERAKEILGKLEKGTHKEKKKRAEEITSKTQSQLSLPYAIQ